MKLKRIFAVVLGALMLASVAAFAGCEGSSDAGGDAGRVALSYYDYYDIEDDTAYNHETVYENDLETVGADPSVIYVTEGDQAGYYYMYITSDDIGASGYLSYRSTNLNDWECMGLAYSPVAYYDAETDTTYSSFASANFWAPEVIYDEDLKLYFMFYNASYLYRGLEFYIDVAVSENPQGPYTQYALWIQEQDDVSAEVKAQWAPVEDAEAADTAGVNKMMIYKPLLDFSKMDPSDDLYETRDNGYMKVIDASPFIDPVSGDKYLYFCHDLGGSYSTSTIYVIAMNDDWTPKLDENGYYAQVEKLTDTACLTVGGTTTASLSEGNVNEAPFVVYNEESGLYYLMFSVNSFTEKTYQVHTAVSTSPTGPFTKLTREEGGFLLYADSAWSYASGTGHHSFVTVGDTTYIVYHAHQDRMSGNSTRAIAFDEVVWTENGDEEDSILVPYVNGPSYAYMPQTAGGEWSNIADEATVESDNVAAGSSVEYLNDGIIDIHGDDFIYEFEMDAGAATITITFDDYREITALFIYQSNDYDLAFNQISSVEFSFRDGDVTGTAYTEALLFDWDKYYLDGFMVAGANFAIEFAPMEVNKITITLPNVNFAHAISEIMVLGK